MNILLYHSQKDSLEMISFCLESQVDLVVNAAPSFQQAIDFFLGETPVDLVIAGEHGETDKLFKFMLSTNSATPVIILSEKPKEPFETYPDIRILSQLHPREVPEKLISLIKSHFAEILSLSTNEEFCRINTSLLVRVVPLRADLYIRLSSIKFVKIFKAGATFSKEDLEKFLVKKKVSFLYVKKNESLEFVQKFQQDIAAQFASSKVGDPSLMDTVAETQELIQELSARLGFTEEVRKLAKSNVDLAIKAIGDSPKLTKVLNASALSGQNFISSHSLFLANISCSIAAHMKWPSDTTFQKLVMAALFHDFTFQNPEHAKVATLAQLDAMRPILSAEEYNMIRNHPVKCSDAIKQLNEVPSDVDTIVIQHHERPDGSGFPRGLRSHQLAPLSAVFIVAHDLLDNVFQKKGSFDLVTFLKDSEKIYQGQAFKKVWTALANSEGRKVPSSEGQGNPAA